MDVETVKRLLMCGKKLHDWQTDTAMAIIDLLQHESLTLAAICCCLFDEETCQNMDYNRAKTVRACEFAKDVSDILEKLTKGGVVETHFSEFRLKECQADVSDLEEQR